MRDKQKEPEALMQEGGCDLIDITEIWWDDMALTIKTLGLRGKVSLNETDK